MEKDRELEILRKLANHYAENGYSKAVAALKEIDDETKPTDSNIIQGNRVYRLLALGVFVVIPLVLQLYPAVVSYLNRVLTE